MGRLFRIIAVTLLATPAGATIALGAPAPRGFDPTVPSGGRILLTCTGTMKTADMPGDVRSAVTSTGMVDLDGGMVTGFGVGRAEIVSARPEAVVFGDSPETGVMRLFTAANRTAPMPKGGARLPPQVAGTFDRTTGATRILVHAANAPETVLIAMDLQCRMAPAPLP
jgi:hypothetical protein